MKLTTILTAALLGGVALPTLAFADAPVFPGAAATPCDPERFTPIFGKDGATVLYWNNPTCVYGGSDAPNPTEVSEPVDPVDPEEPTDPEEPEEPAEPTEPETDEA